MPRDAISRGKRAAAISLAAPVLALLPPGGPGLAAPPAPSSESAGSDVTTVGTLTVRAAVPIPKVGDGAPLLSVDEIHAAGYDARDQRSTFEDQRAALTECYVTAFGVGPNAARVQPFVDSADAARRISNWSRVAEAATSAAQIARVDAALGKVGLDLVDKTELARQNAVNELTKAEKDLEEAREEAIDLQEMISDGIGAIGWTAMISSKAAERAGRKYAQVPQEFEDLRLQDIRAAQRQDDKSGPFVLVTGSIVNTRQKRISVPPLAIKALDQFGFSLAEQSGEAKGYIAPGQAAPFSFALKPQPDHIARVTVTFAGIRGPRHLNPVAIDPVCANPPPGNSPWRLEAGLPNSEPEDLRPFDPRLVSGAPAPMSARVWQRR